MHNRSIWLRTLALPVVGTALSLAACSSSVVVQSEFPTPLIEPLPVRMGVLIDEELYNYIYAEAIPQQSTWTIDLGDANVALLEPLFASMFDETVMVSEVPLGPQHADLDGVVRPTLAKFEFDVPIGQRDQFVEVWMQYNITLYEPDGEVVTEWPVSGYGKAELSGKRELAVRRAAIVAMREVGATISTKFASQPDVSYWLEERRNAAGSFAESRAD